MIGVVAAVVLFVTVTLGKFHDIHVHSPCNRLCTTCIYMYMWLCPARFLPSPLLPPISNFPSLTLSSPQSFSPGLSLCLHTHIPSSSHTGYGNQHGLSANLSVNGTTLERSGDWVLVEWQHVDNPSASDWIGLYTVPEDFNGKIDPTLKAPVKFQVSFPSLYFSPSLPLSPSCFFLSPVSLAITLSYLPLLSSLPLPILVRQPQSDPHERRTRVFTVSSDQHQRTSHI